MDATLSRNGTTVTLPLLEESSGTSLIARDIGKPSTQVRETEHRDPIFTDVYSGIENYFMVGRFFRSSAHADAIELADLIKSHGSGSAIDFSVPLARFDDASVVPAGEQQEALTLTYDPGRKDWVQVQLSVSRISDYLGASDPPASQLASTPTAAGTGPIQLTDGSTTVNFENDIVVERTVGRPGGTLSRTTNAAYPRYQDRITAAYDVFSLEVVFNSSTESTVRDLNDLVGQRLTRTPLTLKFNGLYGMGDISTVPVGTQAARDVLLSGHEGVAQIPTVELRVARQI